LSLACLLAPAYDKIELKEECYYVQRHQELLSSYALSNGLATIALIISVRVYFKNKLYSSAEIEQKLQKDLSLWMASIQKRRQDHVMLNDESSQSRLQVEITAYLDAIEQGCYFYYSGKIQKKAFNSQFVKDIRLAFDEFGDRLSSPGEYPFANKYYSRYLRP
jgi:hypothetical protein